MSLNAPLTVGSLFAGIGGFDLGFERAGFEIRWQVEIDPFCRAVLAKHWPDVRRYEDVRTVGADLEYVDVLCGGFPCQDVSSAGARIGIDGARSGLWGEFHRLIRELRPRYAVVENTEGLLARGMGRVLGGLAEIGYDADWTCVRCTDLDGVHERERVFLVAYPDAQHGEARVGLRDTEERPLLAGRYPQRSPFWLASTGLTARMDDGLSATPYRARVEAIGNAVVPQITEWIAERIKEAEGR